jgi:hypothetical protein
MKKLLFILFILALSATEFSCNKKIENPIKPNDTSKIDTNSYNTYNPIIKTGVYFHLSHTPLDSIKNMLCGKWIIRSGLAQGTYVNFINTNGLDSIIWYKDSVYYSNGPAEWYKYPTGSNPDSTVNVKLYSDSFITVWMLEYGNTDSLYIYQQENYYFLTKIR